MKSAKTILFIIFILLALCQLAVQLMTISGAEKTVSEGHTYLFKTRVYDPLDYMKGRYITLNYEISEQPLSKANFGLKKGQEVFVSLKTGTNGFAEVKSVRVLYPPKGEDYVTARVSYIYGKKFRLKFPFERYYLNEFKAPEAQRLFRRRSPAWAVVRVLDGKAVIENVILDGKPLKELLEESQPEK